MATFVNELGEKIGNLRMTIQQLHEITSRNINVLEQMDEWRKQRRRVWNTIKGNVPELISRTKDLKRFEAPIERCKGSAMQSFQLDFGYPPLNLNMNFRCGIPCLEQYRGMILPEYKL